MEPVDVVILTLNSQRMLKQCIESIYRNVPVKNLIVVDGFSTDSTQIIVEEFKKKYRNVTFIQTKGTRGTARQVAIKRVTTDWFIFVDSDVLLSKNWFAQAEKLVNDDVGAIWGIEIWSVMQENRRLLNLFERVTLKIFETRGGTHDMLIRRKAVEDIKIPYQLHTYEDAFIKSWITSKGYKAIGVYEPYCIHYRADQVWTAKKHVELMVTDLKFALPRPMLLLPYGFYSAIVTYQIAINRLKKNRISQKRFEGIT